jgi:3-methyladenine DNA glycosylase AlkD
MTVEEIRKTLRQRADKKRAQTLQRFFKTGRGDYAEGDIFLGIKVPVLRNLAIQFQDVPLNTAIQHLKSPIHEERLLALFILIKRYQKEGVSGKQKIYSIYLAHTKYINNWDLVDATAKHIIGAFLTDKDRAPLYTLARSDSLWERRIAILSTFHFIENNDFEDTLNIAEILIADPHDLIHKAVGWMLREVGKRSAAAQERFLRKYCAVMPRTMLRYAIEKFPQSKRQAYLHGIT